MSDQCVCGHQKENHDSTLGCLVDDFTDRDDWLYPCLCGRYQEATP